jgi:uncharacterized membrane protein HdeD (DUF308 family)
MLVLFARHWWVLALRGTLAVLFGLMALVWPKDTLALFMLWLVGYALVDGVVTGVVSLRLGARAWPGLLEAMLGLGCAIAVALWPRESVQALVWVVAAWALATGLIEFVVGLSLRRELAGERWLAAAGVVSIALGVMLFAWPEAGVLACAWLIGGYAVVFGSLLIALSARLRRLAHRPSSYSYA